LPLTSQRSSMRS